MRKRWRLRRIAVPDEIGQFLKRPQFVVFYPGVVTYIVAEAVAVKERLMFSGFLGLWATLWALVLAALIYFINGSEQRELRSQIDGLEGSMSAVVEGLVTAQSAEQLLRAKTDYKDYLDALRRAFPVIPESDIVTVERLPGKGNQPVIIETKMRRYSVWRGGRNGGFHVNKLANLDG